MAIGLVPDTMLRVGVRSALRRRLRQLHKESLGRPMDSDHDSPIAVETATANEQHYEVPTEFFHLVLGPRLKYSSGLWSKSVTNLAEAEESMLEVTARRAGLKDGQRILALGSGWGAFAIWAAQRYPSAHITALTNSRTQATYIHDQTVTHDLSNLSVRRANAATLDLNLDGRFDRIVSVEMLEHIRNVEPLLNHVAELLEVDGRFFAHVFSHKTHRYTFEAETDGWMARWFFSGGTMPNLDHLTRASTKLRPMDRWIINGRHYADTLQAWIQNLDSNRQDVLDIFRDLYGPRNAALWLVRWRLFFIACQELFDFRKGTEWVVAHHLFEPTRR